MSPDSGLRAWLRSATVDSRERLLRSGRGLCRTKRPRGRHPGCPTVCSDDVLREKQLLADEFLPCKVGLLGARYDRADESVVQRLPDGRERRIRLRPVTSISTAIRRRNSAGKARRSK